MEEIEEWRVIKDFPNYMVSSLGRVKSLDRYVNHYKGGFKLCKGQYLKPDITWDDYLRVGLSKNGKHTHKRVNRLVAEAFIQNPDNLPQVGHKDECKTNNCVSNLYWTTAKENNNHGKHNERVSKGQINRKDCSKHIYQYTLDGEFIREWLSSGEIQRELGFNRHNICNCCRGVLYKSAHGYIWKYKEKDAA